VSAESLGTISREVWHELAPVARRAADLDARSIARIRASANSASLYVRLPFGVLVGRTIRTEGAHGVLDVAVGAIELLGWVDEEIRPLVRAGALAHKEAAAREGAPGAQPRAEVADALLNSIVLTARADTAHDDTAHAEISLRALSALTRMGFLKRDGSAHIDVAGRWIRIAAEYGTVFLERPGSGLSLR